jgi:hypothetical protein
MRPLLGSYLLRIPRKRHALASEKTGKEPRARERARTRERTRNSGNRKSSVGYVHVHVASR